MALILEIHHSRDNHWSVPISSIDLNADIGEHDGDRFASDIAIMSVVSSANIACGEHAGSLDVMRQTVRNARDRGIAIGAHPGYPDREGFGRRETGLGIAAIVDSFAHQIQRMAECCASERASLSYVKPHGALYNRAVHDEDLATRLAETVFEFDASLLFLGLPGTFLESAALAAGLRFAREAFIDRGYMSDGTLVPRGMDGALIEDSVAAAERAVTMVRDHSVLAIDGTTLTLMPDSLCVHGDGARALETVSAARAALEAEGFTIEPFAP